MTKAITNEREAFQEVLAKINEIRGKRWMVAVWSVEGEDDKAVLEPARRITWRFPTADFDKAVGRLALSLAEETRATEPAEPPPLKEADLSIFAGGDAKEEIVEKPESPSDGSPVPKPLSISEFMEGREEK